MLRITATFHPEAWINDHAVEIDPLGPTTFDVSDYLLETYKEEAILSLKDGSHETDELRDLGPQWVKDWNGPYRVSVQQSILDFYENRPVSDDILATYRSKGGSVCPRCGGEDVEGGDNVTFESEGIVTSDSFCGSCDLEWQEVFTLQHINICGQRFDIPGAPAPEAQAAT